MIQWLFLILFLGSIIYNIVAVAQASGSSDAKNDMIKAITNVTIVNTVLMLVMGGMAYIFVGDNTKAPGGNYAMDFKDYMMLMVHVSLLISIISVSISSLQQLNSS